MNKTLSYILLLLLCVGCNNNPMKSTVSDGEINNEEYIETEIAGDIYHQGDLDVLQDIIDANENVGGFYSGLGGETPLEIGGVECKQPEFEILYGDTLILNSDYPLGCQVWEDGRLKVLNLDERLVTFLPESIGNLTELEELSLREGLISSLPNSFFDLHNLKKLGLDNNPLTTLSESITQLSNLTTLSLYDTDLTTIPENIGDLSNLRYLILESSRLISLPESICNLPSDCGIYVSYNQLCEEYHYDCIDDLLYEWGEQECDESLGRRRGVHVHDKYIQLNIQKETDVYTTDYILPDHAPYVMEITVTAITNNIKGQLNWYTDREYVIHECPDDWECPYIFDLMSDSTTYSNNRGISRNTILVSPEFVNDTITIYSDFIDENKKRHSDSISLVLEW